MSEQFPWYGSHWLSAYTIARKFIHENHPEKLRDFVHAFDVFRTPPEFTAKKLPGLFDESTVSELRSLIKEIDVTKTPAYELRDFGRFVVHDAPFANSLQERIKGLVGELVGEPVEPCYNFLSLYWEMGVCDVHMDAPFAKWTVDYCIEQSSEWPIHLSRIVPWPENREDFGEDWQNKVKADPANRFESYVMREGEAIVFSGSSQWHYRDPIERQHSSNFCNLIFFHFIPAGTSDLIVPSNWKDLFGIPDLAGLATSTDYPL